MTGAAPMRGRGRGWRFIDLAELGHNTARSYGATLLRITLYPLGVAGLLGIAVAIDIVLKHNTPGSIDPIVTILTQFGLIVVAGLAVLRSVEKSHLRPWRSLVAPDLTLDWRRLAIGCGVQLEILASELVLIHRLTGWPWRWSLATGLPLFILAACLIALQSASEELLFRGYLTQALGRIVRSRVLIALIVGVVFGLLHMNAHGPLTVLYYLVLSLVFSLVSLRDERLELAIGGHAGINLFAFWVANLPLVGPGILGGGGGAMAFNGVAILVVAVNGALFYGLTRLLVRVFCKPRSVI